MSKPSPLKVCYFDAATSPGGTTTLTEIIFSGINRDVVSPRLFTALPRQEAFKRFKEQDITLPFSMNVSYTARENLLLKLKLSNKYLIKLTVYLFSLAQILTNIIPFLRILKSLKEERPDIVHIHNFETALLAAYLLKIPVIWHFHGVPCKPGRVHRLLQPIISNYLCISDFVMKEAVTHHYPKDKLITLLNPAPPIDEDIPDNIRSLYAIPDDAILISHFGRLVPWKGQLEFLKAFTIALKTCPELFALIAGGDGENFGYNYKESLETYISENDLSRQVILAGHVDSPHSLMATSDIVVHSSIMPEPFGLVITEAMSNGTAVICSNLGAPPEIIEDEVTGVIVDPVDSHALASAMIKLSQDRSFRLSLAQQAKQQAAEKFNSLNYIRQLESLYLSI